MRIAIWVFVALESLNILTLYFRPGSRLGNGIGVFNAWESSKGDAAVHRLVRYLVNWVAGTKLIFVGLLALIALRGDGDLQLAAGAVMVLSILSFFWRLFPLALEMDRGGELTPRGYAKTLGLMIAGFIALFGGTLAWALWTRG